MIKLRPVHGVQLVSIDAPLPHIKGVDGSVVGLGFTVVVEDDYYEYEIVRARVSASVWRKKLTAVVILLGVLAGMS